MLIKKYLLFCLFTLSLPYFVTLPTLKISNTIKPTQMFEKIFTPTEFVQTEIRGEMFGRKMVYVVVGIVAFVLVVTAVLLSVYFGMKMAKDNYKEYRATYVGDDGDILNEKVIVTDREEVFSNDVVTGIADFSTGLVTIKVIKPEFPVHHCYVTNMNYSDFQTPKEFTSTHTASQITFETKNMVRRRYEVTDIWLNNKALGPRSAELCKDKAATFLVEKTDLATTQKRRFVNTKIKIRMRKVHYDVYD